MTQNIDNPSAIVEQRTTASFTPALDTSQFASGDSMATLLTEVTGVARSNGGAARITGMTILDKAANGTDVEVWLFNASTATLPTVNAAWNISDPDAAGVVGVLRTATDGVWYASTSNKIGQVRAINLDVKCATGQTSLWAAVICRSGTPTYGASDLVFTLAVQQFA